MAIGPSSGVGFPREVPLASGSDRPQIEAATITLAVTTKEETWSGLAAFGWLPIVGLFAIEFLRMVLEAMSLLVLVNGTQSEKIRFWEAVELTLESYFIGQLIPVSAAGVPYQAFLLTRKGVRAGWATAVVLVKGFVPGVFFFVVLVVSVVAALFGWSGSPASLTYFKIIAPISVLPIGVVIALLYIMLRRPALFDRLVEGVAAFLGRKLRGRAAERVNEVRDRLESESRVFREALTTIGRKRPFVLAGGATLVMLAFVIEFMIAVVILWGFGYRGSVVEPVALQCILKPILTASPAPGSLAVGEGGYIGFFVSYLPEAYIGVSLVLWRLAVYFVPMFVGGVLVARRIGMRMRRAVITPNEERQEIS